MTVDHTHRSPPPGIRYAAERGSRLIHLHRVHESREGEDAHGDEKKEAAHLNQDGGVCVISRRHSTLIICTLTNPKTALKSLDELQPSGYELNTAIYW